MPKEPTTKQRTSIYVDGFNFYYGAVKYTPYKWLNLAEMFQKLLPNDNVKEIKYFTSCVHSRPNDPNVQIRQQVYIRALKTIPNLKFIFGNLEPGK